MVKFDKIKDACYEKSGYNLIVTPSFFRFLDYILPRNHIPDDLKNIITRNAGSLDFWSFDNK